MLSFKAQEKIDKILKTLKKTHFEIKYIIYLNK